MLRRAHELSAEDLHGLPDACRTCVLWEHTGPGRGDARARAPGDRESAEQSKIAWWQSAQLEWGPPGKALYERGRLIAYTSFAPSQQFTWARKGGRVSEDALLLATLWVEPGYRRSGLAKLLLQGVLREATRRGCRAVEAFGVRGPAFREWACVLPEDFLLAHGFQVVHDHHRHPLLRLDLRQTARWQESVSHALEGVRSALARGERAPAPAPYVRPAASLEVGFRPTASSCGPGLEGRR